VVPEILNPKNTWKDPVAFEKAADGLAQEFATFFDANFADSGLSEAVIQACPGK
jgi:ATP-dependent phosphoenolpyruvate carboxykinase